MVQSDSNLHTDEEADYGNASREMINKSFLATEREDKPHDTFPKEKEGTISIREHILLEKS